MTDPHQAREPETQSKFAWLLERTDTPTATYWTGNDAEPQTTNPWDACWFSRVQDATRIGLLWFGRPLARAGWRTVEHGFPRESATPPNAEEPPDGMCNRCGAIYSRAYGSCVNTIVARGRLDVCGGEVQALPAGATPSDQGQAESAHLSSTTPEGSQTVGAQELLDLLRTAYGRVPAQAKGRSRCVDYDPAGSTYEFTEHEWSARIRAILGIKHEPTGI